jgi:D-arabinose 1-dehydrogenase-like Zn-dependent alcohol dehydrogenase
MKAIRVEKQGGPEVLKLVNIAPMEAPGPGQAVVRVIVAGVNFLDVGQRRGTYPREMPCVVLIHAAAGGMGGLLVQWAKHFGASVIGTVSTEAKAHAARGVPRNSSLPTGSPRQVSKASRIIKSDHQSHRAFGSFEGMTPDSMPIDHSSEDRVASD